MSYFESSWSILASRLFVGGRVPSGIQSLLVLNEVKLNLPQMAHLLPISYISSYWLTCMKCPVDQNVFAMPI